MHYYLSFHECLFSFDGAEYLYTSTKIMETLMNTRMTSTILQPVKCNGETTWEGLKILPLVWRLAQLHVFNKLVFYS